MVVLCKLELWRRQVVAGVDEDSSMTWRTLRLKTPSRFLSLLACVNQRVGSRADVLSDAGVTRWCW